MTEIIEKTKELGALLQASEQVRTYTEAKAAYEQNEAVQKLVKEFNLHKMTMMSLTQKENADHERIAEVEERIKGVYQQIMAQESMKRMQETGKAVDALLSQVNAIISFYVTGEEATGCNHDCGSCGGCH